MAWQVTKRIWDTAREIKQSDKLLLLALAEFADEQSVCWPSYETLAEMIGVNRRSAIRIVENLEEWGHVYIDQHAVGRSNTNTFLIATGLAPPEIEKILIERFGKSPDDAKVSTNTLIGKQDDYRKGVTHNTKSFPESGRYKRPKGVKADTKSVTHNTISHSQKGVMREQKVLPVTQKGVMDDTRTIIEPSTKPPLRGRESPAPIPKKQKKQREPPSPAYKVFIEITEYFAVNTHWRNEMARIVGDKPEDLEFWRKVIIGWTGKYPSKHNVEGMLDYYQRREIPGYQQPKNGVKPHGTYQRSNEKPTGESAKGERTTDTSTREYVYPDGHREPIPDVPPMPRLPRDGILSS